MCRSIFKGHSEIEKAEEVKENGRIKFKEKNQYH